MHSISTVIFALGAFSAAAVALPEYGSSYEAPPTYSSPPEEEYPTHTPSVYQPVHTPYSPPTQPYQPPTKPYTPSSSAPYHTPATYSNAPAGPYNGGNPPPTYHSVVPGPYHNGSNPYHGGNKPPVYTPHPAPPVTNTGSGSVCAKNTKESCCTTGDSAGGLLGNLVGGSCILASVLGGGSACSGQNVFCCPVDQSGIINVSLTCTPISG